jgi:ubiquinone/menaquinone biosynthesis C-methylase UbiE
MVAGDHDGDGERIGETQMQHHSPEIRRISTIYDRLAPQWNARLGFVERRLMGEALRRTLGNWLQGDVLEIGTGTGATLPHVDFSSGRITSFTGTDISPGMLDEAKKSVEPNDRLRFALLPADALAFPDASFDTVTCSLVLCTVPDPEKALREMSRVCKPDGRVIVLEHVRARNPLLAFMQKILTPVQARMIGCHFDRKTDQLLHDLGFAVEHEERRFFGIFVLLRTRPISPAAGSA